MGTDRTWDGENQAAYLVGLGLLELLRRTCNASERPSRQGLHAPAGHPDRVGLNVLAGLGLVSECPVPGCNFSGWYPTTTARHVVKP